MATLTIRGVDDATHSRLRALAARNGRSVEAEVRAVLASVVRTPTRNLLLELRDRLGQDYVEVQVPKRKGSHREVELS